MKPMQSSEGSAKAVCCALPFLFFVAIACGGSSSETPMPLEPVPHTDPEPVVTSEPHREEEEQEDEPEEAEPASPPEQD